MNARQARRRRAEQLFAQSYVKKIVAAHERGVISSAPGTVNNIWVYHDDDCPKLRGGLCNCNPDLEVIFR
jgi:hypothetical protein